VPPSSATPVRGLARYLPVLTWARTYDRAWLRPDVVAGLTVTALVVPKGLGYAEIAGVPIEHGLYAVAAGTILYALLGTSRQVSTGPSSALSAVAGSALLAAGAAGDENPVAIVTAIAIVVGLLFLLMAVLRMGWISQFISRAVIVGFLFGAAIDVSIGELPQLSGTSADGDNAWREAASWLAGLGDTHLATLLVGVTSLVVLFGLHAVAPRVPGALVVVVGGIAASALFDLDSRGVALVGDVPRGLPVPVLPDLGLVVDNLGVILLAAVGITLIGFSQSAGDARYFATKNGYRVDINQESLAQGVANVGSGLFQGIPVSTSLSASSLNDHAGSRTPVASLTTGAMTLLTMVLLAPFFSGLPKAVLAAVIIEAVVFGMMDVAAMRRLYRVKRSDFWIALAAIVGVLSAGVLAGVLVGVALSVLWLVRRATSPDMPVLGRAPGSHVFLELDENPDAEVFPGVLVLRLDGSLFFVTADALGDRIRELVDGAEPPVTTVVLDMKSVNFVDSQGVEKLDELARLGRQHGITLRLARVKPAILTLLRRGGALDTIGQDHVHPDVHTAVESELQGT
jgi:SulP family sulfate permease